MTLSADLRLPLQTKAFHLTNAIGGSEGVLRLTAMRDPREVDRRVEHVRGGRGSVGLPQFWEECVPSVLTNVSYLDTCPILGLLPLMK